MIFPLVRAVLGAGVNVAATATAAAATTVAVTAAAVANAATGLPHALNASCPPACPPPRRIRVAITTDVEVKFRKECSYDEKVRFCREEVRKAFEKFDTDCDGKINRDQFKSALRHIDPNIPEQEITAAFRVVYPSCDYYALVTLKQFLKLFSAGVIKFVDN